MMTLVLIGLIMICAKLWFEIGALRVRVDALEISTELSWQPEVVEEVWSAADPMPPPPASVFAPEPHGPTVDPVPEPLAEPAFEDSAEGDNVESLATARGVNFEDLFGRKLPIWGGGITLAVAGFLIVKYSIDAGLLSPVVRVVMGLVFGGGLIAGAELALRADDKIRDPRVRQALAGAGIATVYASILIAASLYHLIAPATGFVGMALTTILAGALSLRFGAPSAVLGLVGGLAAPALVGSGSPDVPLLSAYLALTVGGLCALSRTQRWMWLGALALVGGFGWALMLILGGALDSAGTVSVGAFTLLLGIALPLAAFARRGGMPVRLFGSLAACAQLAALVAIGGFAPMTWGLYGLVSIAIVWLSRREAALVDLPAAGLAVALLLAAYWPAPAPPMLAAVMAGIAVIFGLPVAQRMWRDTRPSGSIQLAAIAAAIVALPVLHLAIGESIVALLALLGAAMTGLVAALGWKTPKRVDDPRFAILTTTAAGLIATAAVVIVPAWCVAPAVAVVAVGLLVLGERAGDSRIDMVAALFGTAALLAVLVAPASEWRHVFGFSEAAASSAAMLRWLMPAMAAVVFAWRSRLPEVDKIAQPLAVLLGYGAIAQIVPAPLLPLIPVALFGAFALSRRTVPALVTAGVLTALWAALPFGTWLGAGAAAIAGVPTLIGAMPSLGNTLLRLALPAAACAFVTSRHVTATLRRVMLGSAAVLAGISLHIVFKHLFGIADTAAFIHLGMAERTVWEMLLAAAAVALWRRVPIAAQALAAASVAHFVGFTLILHDPLWSLQAVGRWPVANLLLPAFGTAFALTWLAQTLPLPSLALRAREWLRMALILAFAAATLRQAFHGSLLEVGAVGDREDIARSVLLIVLAIGFLRHGIAAGMRDWRIASLVLMLAAVGKVFLVDIAGLGGLLRIASFVALGFSLIGVGWLYSRYLPEDTALTPRSGLDDRSSGGN